MRTVSLAILVAAFLGGCAREGLRPVLSYPRDIIPAEEADIQDAAPFEERTDEPS